MLLRFHEKEDRKEDCREEKREEKVNRNDLPESGRDFHTTQRR